MRLLDYTLPEDLIAQHPTARREDSRLLVVARDTGALADTRFASIGDWLRPGDLLVVNETRVRPARLMLQRPTGGRVEMLFVRPAAHEGGEGAWQVAVANYGLRPTVEAAVAPRLEVHVLGPCNLGEGDAVEVEWLEFMRPERKFAGVAELVAQIAADAAAARAWFEAREVR